MLDNESATALGALSRNRRYRREIWKYTLESRECAGHPAPRVSPESGVPGSVAVARIDRMTHSVAPRRIRVARLSWLSACLAVTALTLLVLAVFLAVQGAPERDFSVLVPLPLEFVWPGIGLLFAAGLFAAAALIGVAALQTAAGARVLGRRGG